MLRMGVTTATGGQCGINVHRPSEYLDVIDREGAAVNVGMFAGHAFMREQAGHADKYSRVTEDELRAIENSAARELDGGCLGISFGIRYVPGIDAEELRRTAAPCRKDGKVIAAHIRDDAAQVGPAARELLEAGRELGVSAQVSHIGSMGGFGQMRELLRLVDGLRIGGLYASCDCYPYTAFSTMIGSTTYDDGWRERYGGALIPDMGAVLELWHDAREEGVSLPDEAARREAAAQCSAIACAAIFALAAWELSAVNFKIANPILLPPPRDVFQAIWDCRGLMARGIFSSLALLCASMAAIVDDENWSKNV